jgi:hypothetical protein
MLAVRGKQKVKKDQVGKEEYMPTDMVRSPNKKYKLLKASFKNLFRNLFKV